MSRLESSLFSSDMLKGAVKRTVQATLLAATVTTGAAHLESATVFANESVAKSSTEDLGSAKRNAKEFCEKQIAPNQIPVFEVQELGTQSVKKCLRDLV